ncbi:hypothetical protein DV706_17700 (plasmid) [Natronorubrum bangense]|uniref:Cell surface glycoprotein n=3 Tax=Natronorubrum bangense TaxID=61858 RepID=L9WCH6_9EURY|nr:hypothetical protein C494_14196 [Natronorubrum bangense JCM 10635]QCC56367.1 hypothetical protein DV706_17700 [Natronorubrum bangense]
MTASLAVTPAAGSGYDIEVVPSVSTPQETIEIEGDQFNIDGIGVVEPGDPIEIDVTSSADYRVTLYNTDADPELESDLFDADDSRITIGDNSDELDTTDLKGTYVLTLDSREDGRQAVYPVVVQAFDIHLEYPSTATQGETVEINATIDSSDTSMVESVEVALWDGSDDDATETLDSQDDGTYSTTLDLDDYDEGEYEIYGAAFGDDEAEGYPAPIAIEDGETMTVSADDSHEDDEDSDDSENDTDEESGSDAPENETDGEDSEPDLPGNETDSEGGESDMPGNETDTESGLADNSSEETEEHSDDEDGENETGVISPNDEDDDGTSDQDDDDAVGTPGAVFLTVFLLLGLLVFGSHVREGSQ